MGILTSIYHPLPIYPSSPFDKSLIDINGIGNVGFHTEEIEFPKKYKYFKNPQPLVQIPFKDLMLCTGMMLSPAKNTQSFANWGFLLEHFDSITKNNNIARYATHAKKWDSRVKAIFSERLSCGIAAWSLWNIDNIIHIADVADFLGKNSSHTQFSRMGIDIKNKGISDLRPDFFCLTKSAECVIVECKGSMGTPSTLSSDIEKGKQQVQNVMPIGVKMRKEASQLVYATNLRCFDDNPRKGCDSTIRVIDPIFGENAVKLSISADELVLKSYGKLLGFMGRSDIYAALTSGKIFSRDDLDEFQVSENFRFVPLSSGLRYLMGFQSEVAKILLCTPREGLSLRINEVIQEFNRSELNSSFDLALPNGFFIYKY